MRFTYKFGTCTVKTKAKIPNQSCCEHFFSSVFPFFVSFRSVEFFALTIEEMYPVTFGIRIKIARLWIKNVWIRWKILTFIFQTDCLLLRGVFIVVFLFFFFKIKLVETHRVLVESYCTSFQCKNIDFFLVCKKMLAFGNPFHVLEMNGFGCFRRWHGVYIIRE